jgi:hypothetical protein
LYGDFDLSGPPQNFDLGNPQGLDVDGDFDLSGPPQNFDLGNAP